ncbi:2-C-methyl-D-erythritol 2,4-cyclodiphosphate synthase [Timonella sp. A28]|uniref:2-C-methyl-D-erythritol 2,4-cyclodiphosphate synthase n=1 Tax=Timonella sp. A28 TaxID=3442640 RepID=UPI003EBB8468
MKVLEETGHARVVAVVTAAGSGQRLGYGVPKALVPLGESGRIGDDSSLLCTAVRNTAAVHGVQAIVVTAPAADVKLFTELVALLGLQVPCAVVAGGVSRQSSVYAGLQHLKDAQHDADVVLVHDAARALTPTSLMDRVVAAVAHGSAAVIPALEVADTIKLVEDVADAANTSVQRVTGAADRSVMRIVQTPQGFAWDVLWQAHTRFADRSNDEATAATDDSTLAQWAGVEVDAVPGDALALKVTTATDLALARTLFQQEKDAPSSDHTPHSQGVDVNSSMPLVGIGSDVHAFVVGQSEREMWLGGVHFPGEQPLDGHSDADVIAHAAADALFSAAGLGDLGSNFGTSEPQWAGAAGSVLLAEAARRVREAGFDIGNVAVQVIGNKPKVGPQRALMQERMSAAAGAVVRISATTTDALGFAGRGEGLAAIATALVAPRAQ